MKKAHSVLIIGGWCNGNTTDFDSVVPGSSPGSSAIIYRVRIVDNTLACEAGNIGSILIRGTK